MYGYGDFDGPVFRPSAGEFGRYGGRASPRNVEHCDLARGCCAPLRTPSLPCRLARQGGGGPVTVRAAAAGDRADAKWTAPALAIKPERSRQIARIGNNLNQLARWANTTESPVADEASNQAGFHPTRTPRKPEIVDPGRSYGP